jgi:hypothetical protein
MCLAAARAGGCAASCDLPHSFVQSDVALWDFNGGSIYDGRPKVDELAPRQSLTFERLLLEPLHSQENAGGVLVQVDTMEGASCVKNTQIL